MKKAKIVSVFLKIVLIFLSVYGIYNYFYWGLWEEPVHDVFFLLKIIFPFLYFGILGILLGVIVLLDTQKNK